MDCQRIRQELSNRQVQEEILLPGKKELFIENTLFTWGTASVRVVSSRAAPPCREALALWTRLRRYLPL